MKNILFLFIIVNLVSCRSSSMVQCGSTVVQDSVMLSHVIRSTDTVYQHDSVYIYERMKGDTIYLTRTEWRERWRVRVVHDTIHDTQYVEKIITPPPERYVPMFYKWCAIALWAIGLLAIGYWLLKWWVLKR